jgi:hypothetical protein
VGFLFVGYWVDLDMIKHVIPLLLLIGLSYSQGGDKSFSFSSSGSKYGRIPIDNSLYGFTTFTLECWYYESGFSGGD